MAWPMPTAGQWGSGIAMTPEINMANMGSYTAEQWAVMQQQNWQQWTQWQQQYAQWHGQYGDKVSYYFTWYLVRLHIMWFMYQFIIIIGIFFQLIFFVV